MLSFPGAGRLLGQQSSPHSCFVLFQLFSVSLIFFLNYLSVATCSCLLLGFFRSLLVNIGKNICMLFRCQIFCLLLLDVRVRFLKITAKMLIRCS